MSKEQIFLKHQVILKEMEPTELKTCIKYCYEFVNIVCKICIYYLFLNYNISDAREIFIFGEKARDFS